MKDGIHPDYGKVLFVDSATGDEWVTRSTMKSKETREVEGEEIPVVRLEISSASVSRASQEALTRTTEKPAVPGHSGE